ncbi:HAD domain-containing protein [Asticcacaulis solisilvae]|uniref:HAD domain-containing protein n=1 Tax=Asticcacaulis solisilvae TaxID=1217274 RepID=UPI003FD7DAAB
MILFLDYDGVLHPDEVYTRGNRPYLAVAGELFMWAYVVEDALADLPDIRIVISSSWARFLGFERAKAALPPALGQRVIGATWHTGMKVSDHGPPLRYPETVWDRMTRYQQIARWAKRAGLSDWLAIDDNDEGWPDTHRHHLVHTLSATGLGEETAAASLRAALASRYPRKDDDDAPASGLINGG